MLRKNEERWYGMWFYAIDRWFNGCFKSTFQQKYHNALSQYGTLKFSILAHYYQIVFQYLLNRIGKCHILITTINEQKQTFKTTHTIPFNTAKTITPTFKDLKVCSSQDLDPFDNCQPVNCQMKYLGCRSYFDQKQKTCVKIPHCIADPKSDLPDLV